MISKDRPIRITPDFSMETLKFRRAWKNSKKLQMPVPITVLSKTINHNRWREKNIS